MIGCGLQAVERLAIRQVADDVKGGEVEPVGDIDGFSGSSSDAHRGDEQINIFLQERFLFMECFFGKCIGEEPTDSRVIRIIRAKDGVESIRHPADNNAT